MSIDEEIRTKRREIGVALNNRTPRIAAGGIDRLIELRLQKFADEAAKAAPQPVADINDPAALRRLVSHCWVHSGYRDCGYDQMDSEMRALYDAVKKREPDADDEQPVADADVPEWNSSIGYRVAQKVHGYSHHKTAQVVDEAFESELSRRVAEAEANNDTLRDNSRECRQECVELRQQLAASQAEVARLTKLNETPRSFDEAVHGVQSMIDAMGSMDRNRKEIAKLREEVSRLSRPVDGVDWDKLWSAQCHRRDTILDKVTTNFIEHVEPLLQSERNARESADKRAVAAEAERDELREFRNACIVALTNGDWASTVVKGVRKALDKLEDSTAVKVHEKPIIDQLRLHKPNETFGVCSRAIMEIKRLTALLADAERERKSAEEFLATARECIDLRNAELATATERAERAADAERARIVAWLMGQADSGEKYLDDNGLDRNMHPSTVSAISTMRTLAGSIELGIYKGGGDG